MNVREFRRNLAAVLDRAAAGETVEITRDGVPVAVVGPVPPMTLTAESVGRVRFRRGDTIRLVGVAGVAPTSPDIDDGDHNLLGTRWIVPPGGHPLDDGRFGCWLSTRSLRCDEDCASPPAPSSPWWHFTPPFPVGDGEEWRASVDFGGVEYRLRGRPRAPGEIGPSLRDVLDVLTGAGALADEAHAGDLVTEVCRRSLVGGAS